MIDNSTPLPYRQMSRLFGESYVCVGDMAMRYLSKAHDRGVVALLLARLCAADWATDGVLGPPARRTRFGSINAMSRSLGRPFETVRRHVHALAEEELVSIDACGVAIRVDAASRMIPFYTAAHDLLIWLIGEFQTLALLTSPRGPPARPLLGDVLGTALDIDLLPFETLRDALGDWTSMALWSAVTVANVRHVTRDPAAAATFGADYIPDHLRVPASLAMIARALAIPYATAWRHAIDLERRGLMARRNRGWIVAAEHFRIPGIAAGAVTGAHYALRRIGELIALGLDPAEASRSYLHGPPTLATFT